MPDELLHGESRDDKKGEKEKSCFPKFFRKADRLSWAERTAALQVIALMVGRWETPWITVLRDNYSSYLSSMALSEAAILTSPTEKPLKRGNKCPAEFCNSHLTGERKWPQLSFYYAQSKTNFVWALVCKVALIEKQMSAEDRKYTQIVKIQSTRK